MACSMFATLLPICALVFSNTVHGAEGFEKRQECESGYGYFPSCGKCCPYLGLAGCYQPLSGLNAGEWDCYDYPPGDVVSTVSNSYSITGAPSTSAAYSASTALYTQSAGYCGIGETACGSGCMFVGDECCPSGTGSCSLGDTCVVRDDGTEGCCPLLADCDGTPVGYYSSSAVGSLSYSSFDFGMSSSYPTSASISYSISDSGSSYIPTTRTPGAPIRPTSSEPGLSASSASGSSAESSAPAQQQGNGAGSVRDSVVTGVTVIGIFVAVAALFG